MRLATAVYALMLGALLLAGCQSASHHSGVQRDDVKSLSAAERADLVAGRGMGFAKAAELNGYPGPLHVLELAEALSLTPEQRAQTQALFERMNARARALGAALIAAEGELDRAFGEGAIDSAVLRDKLDAIVRLQAELRFVHLDAHLTQRAILSGEQVRLYNRRRGYAEARREGDG